MGAGLAQGLPCLAKPSSAQLPPPVPTVKTHGVKVLVGAVSALQIQPSESGSQGHLVGLASTPVRQSRPQTVGLLEVCSFIALPFSKGSQDSSGTRRTTRDPAGVRWTLPSGGWESSRGEETHEMQPAQTGCCFLLVSQSLGVSVSVPLKWVKALPLGDSMRGGERRDGESSPDGEAGDALPLHPRVCPHYSVLTMFALAANCKY